jgi:hypothetical protein
MIPSSFEKCFPADAALKKGRRPKYSAASSIWKAPFRVAVNLSFQLLGLHWYQQSVHEQIRPTMHHHALSQDLELLVIAERHGVVSGSRQQCITPGLHFIMEWAQKRGGGAGAGAHG